MKKLKFVFQTSCKTLLAIFSISIVVFSASQSVKALSGEQLQFYAANDIMFYNPGECTSRSRSSLDLSSSPLDSAAIAKITSAKNAEVDVGSQLSSDSEWSARWSDNDTASMARLLNNYGDLAYQLGEAVGAPWIAILVQMRYEDPNSVCGANNFWGNGCDSKHNGAGEATRQGANLGEGFVQYGNTLMNGFHNQALGISDPKEYLEKLGPTWVQGDINGAGYGSIDSMKKSVDALSSFADSEEGQAIVKDFGNYTGTHTNSSLSTCGSSIATNGNAVFYQQGDPRWGGKPYGDCGGDTIANAGCGPTSLASIIATLTEDASITPDIIAEQAAGAGYRVCGSGSSHAITDLAEKYGLTVTPYGKPPVSEINEKLRNGEMFQVAGKGPTPFTPGGHFIAIRGITDDGKWLIFDSAHEDANTKAWDPDFIYKLVHSVWRGVKK